MGTVSVGITCSCKLITVFAQLGDECVPVPKRFEAFLIFSLDFVGREAVSFEAQVDIVWYRGVLPVLDSCKDPS